MQHQFAPSSRVWVYQANPAFKPTDTIELEQLLHSFAQQWVSHSRQLQAKAEVRHSRFIILLVDESMAGASGCRIDSSVRFMQQIEQKFNVQLFDRLTFAYQQDDKIQTASRDEFAQLYAKGIINDDTLVFDNLVNSKAALDNEWVKPLHQSWHAQMV